MTITYMIGNGFDLGLGLRTDYESFKKWYVHHHDEKSEIVQKMLGDINFKPSFWKDVELGFGRLPFSSYAKDGGNALVACGKDIMSSLFDYLSEEQNRFTLEKELAQDVCPKFRKTLVSLTKALIESDKEAEEIELARSPNPNRINIIDFNYTRTLPALLAMDGKYSEIFTTGGDDGDTGPRFRLGSFVYAHGSLGTKDIVFGVDSLDQVKDESARKFCEQNGVLVKGTMMKRVGTNSAQRALDIIASSDRIVLFGLSFGETDRRWWRAVCMALIADTNRKVVVYEHKSNFAPAKSLFDLALNAGTVRLNAFKTIMNSLNIQDQYRLEAALPRVLVVQQGPHLNPDGKEENCDPLHLKWFGGKTVSPL